jgi:hypothetical protein
MLQMASLACTFNFHIYSHFYIFDDETTQLSEIKRSDRQHPSGALKFIYEICMGRCKSGN